MLEVDVHKRLHGPAGEFDLAVRFSVRPGEVLALYGPSGAGKTTVLRLVAGLAAADRGTIAWGGEDWQNVPPRQRGVGFVFQDHALFPNMTVAENLAFAAGRPPVLPEVFELGELVAKYPHQLSGGQRQRVAVARALVQGGGLLLLDEPLSALERPLRRRLGTYLKEAVRKRAVTALLVSHDPDEVIALADRVAVLENGTVKALGKPAELLLEASPDQKVRATVLAVEHGRAQVRIGQQSLWIENKTDLRVGDHVELSLGTDHF